MKKLITKIMDLAVEISGTTVSDVMVTYHGHTRSIDIRVYKEGWSEEALITKHWSEWLDDGNINKFKEILEYLETLTTSTTIIEDLEEKISESENEVEGLKEKIADLENELDQNSNDNGGLLQ